MPRTVTLVARIPLDEDEEAVDGYVQAGVRLARHDEQQGRLLWAIAAASALGLVGAAVVTVLVTRRALAPVRSAFATEHRFVAAASHELRTPVAIVRASADILEREALLAEPGRPLVADILGEADRMGTLVADLLALASAEAGALTLDLRPMDLVAWPPGLTRRAETVAGQAQVAVRTLLPEERSVMALADEDRLTQLALILVDNALAHSPADGTVTIGLAAARRSALVSVADQGPGVPLEERERIFEPFARLPGRRGRGTGSGLGLAIARQLAARHAAQLTVEEAPGGGARFVLRLPVADSR